MCDSMDQNTYSDLHARVNDGDMSDPTLDASRNQIVLAWDQDEPLLINQDLKTCQQCGTNMRNVGGKEECDDKKCDKCGWSVQRHGLPSLVKLDHSYNPKNRKVTTPSGYAEQRDYMNMLAHKYRSKTPDTTVAITDEANLNRLGEYDDLSDVEKKEIMEKFGNGQGMYTVYGAVTIAAIVLLMYRFATMGVQNMPPGQIIIELCLAIFFPVIYIAYLGVTHYVVKSQ
jgi:hypothetical protein